MLRLSERDLLHSGHNDTQRPSGHARLRNIQMFDASSRGKWKMKEGCDASIARGESAYSP